MVRKAGFEPATSCSQSTRSTRLSHILFVTFTLQYFFLKSRRFWRKRWDSNPRGLLNPYGFQDRRLKPDSATLPLKFSTAERKPLLPRFDSIFSFSIVVSHAKMQGSWRLRLDQEWYGGGYWWSQGDSNPSPTECKSVALPNELWPQYFIFSTLSSCSVFPLAEFFVFRETLKSFVRVV